MLFDWPYENEKNEKSMRQNGDITYIALLLTKDVIIAQRLLHLDASGPSFINNNKNNH